MNIRAFLQQKTAGFEAVIVGREMQWSRATEETKKNEQAHTDFLFMQ
jgi:hypothetical protein